MTALSILSNDIAIVYCKCDDCVDGHLMLFKGNILCKVFNGQLNVCDIKMHLQNPEEASVALITH